AFWSDTEVIVERGEKSEIPIGADPEEHPVIRVVVATSRRRAIKKSIAPLQKISVRVMTEVVIERDQRGQDARRCDPKDSATADGSAKCRRAVEVPVGCLR